MTADVERIMGQCRVMGITLEPSPDGEYLDLHYEAPPPEDLRQQLRQHKGEILTILKPKKTTLKKALIQKQGEILTMRKRLASPYYANDRKYQKWGEDIMACLQGHISEIQRYMGEGGALALPPCCIELGHVCLIAMRRFDGCLMTPNECGFSTWDR